MDRLNVRNPATIVTDEAHFRLAQSGGTCRINRSTIPFHVRSGQWLDVTGKTDAAAEAAPDHPPSSAPDGVAVAPAGSHLPDAAEQPSAAFTPAPDGAGTSFPLASPES